MEATAAVRCAGTGTPPVVLDAPDGSPAHWRLVQPGVAAFTRACSHERAQVPGGPDAFAHVAAELRERLHRAAVSPPYVLVGHSLSAAVVRAYASAYPAEVAGLVLVDPMHEELAGRFQALLTPEQAEAYNAAGPPPAALAAWREEARAFRPPGDVPLVILTAGKKPPFPPDWPTDAIWRVWQEELVPQLVGLSPRGVHLVAEEAGHMIPHEQPAAVVDAIRRVIDAARAGGLP
jgi:pimeloyl-ACP methyl ester carboxylesterase